jgi:hypothetical protein
MLTSCSSTAVGCETSTSPDFRVANDPGRFSLDMTQSDAPTRFTLCHPALVRTANCFAQRRPWLHPLDPRCVWKGTDIPFASKLHCRTGSGACLGSCTSGLRPSPAGRNGQADAGQNYGHEHSADHPAGAIGPRWWRDLLPKSRVRRESVRAETGPNAATSSRIDSGESGLTRLVCSWQAGRITDSCPTRSHTALPRASRAFSA